MPAAVEQCVRKRLKDPKFGKGMEPDKRTSMAYAVCWETHKKNNSNDPTAFFDGFLNMGILPDAFFSADKFSKMDVEKFAKKRKKKDRTQATYEALERFRLIAPLTHDSLMFIAQIQSDALFRAEPYYEIDDDAIDNALPIFNTEMFNNLFSSHRYSDEYNIGTIRMVDPASRLALCEIFTGVDDHQGRTVASAIRTKRIKSVSSGMMILQKTCSICGAVGQPYLDCGHWRGQKYDGKEAKVRINKIQYFDLSTVSMPRDVHALILKHESLNQPLKSKTNKVGSVNLINSEVENNSKFIRNSKDLNSMSEDPDKNKEIETNQKELLAKMEQLMQMNQQLLDDKKDLSVRLDTVAKTNETLSTYIQEKNQQQKLGVVEEALDLQLRAKMIDPNKMDEARNVLNSYSPEQLQHAIKSAKRVVELTSGITPPSPSTSHPTNTGVPKSPLAVTSMKQIEGILYKSKMFKHVERLQLKGQIAEEKIKNYDKKFEPITDEDRYLGMSHITINEEAV